MLSLLAVVIMAVVLFKMSGAVFSSAGKFLSIGLKIIGWVVVGGIVVSLVGMTMYVIPILLLIGVIGLIFSAVSS